MTINTGSTVNSQGLAAFSACQYLTLTTSQATDYNSATGTSTVRGRVAINPFGTPYTVSGGTQIDAAAFSGAAVVNQSGTVAYWATVDYTNKVFLASGPLSASLALTMGQTWNLSGFSLTKPTSGAITGTSPAAAIDAVVASIVKVSGDDQGGTIGTAQSSPMIVQALSGSSNPVSGVTISWATTAGTLSAASATTDASGQASVTLTHASTPQTATVTASAGSLSASFKQTGHMALYGTRSPFPVLLKAAGLGDTLAGVGFLPDDGNTWNLVSAMSDEFTGSAIDTTKWNLRLQGGYDHYNDELERYVDSAVTVSNGTCKLTAVARPGTVGHADSPTGFHYNLYDSGCITTKASVVDGFFEARMKLPSGQGVWPAFWALPTSNYQGEVDIMEFVFNNGTERQNMIHNNNLCDSGGNAIFWRDLYYNTQWGFWSAPSTLSPTYMVDDWRVLSCLKQNGTTTVYIDGYPVCQRKISPANLPMQIILNLAMGGGWPTTNSGGQAWTQPVSLGPEVFEIDYVRTYQKA
jgi:hypothetical protein